MSLISIMPARIRVWINAAQFRQTQWRKLVQSSGAVCWEVCYMIVIIMRHRAQALVDGISDPYDHAKLAFGAVMTLLGMALFVGQANGNHFL
ncbi:MAG: hypothetical protein NVS4B8_26390 [Herpetosiphon sp.]